MKAKRCTQKQQVSLCEQAHSAHSQKAAAIQHSTLVTDNSAIGGCMHNNKAYELITYQLLWNYRQNSNLWKFVNKGFLCISPPEVEEDTGGQNAQPKVEKLIRGTTRVESGRMTYNAQN